MTIGRVLRSLVSLLLVVGACGCGDGCRGSASTTTSRAPAFRNLGKRGESALPQRPG